MQATLGGASCRRAPLTSMRSPIKLVSRALSQLTIARPHRPQAPLLVSPSWQGPPQCSLLLSKTSKRSSTTASNSIWRERRARDQYAKNAKVQGLKSRAAFKLLEMDQKYRLFKKNQVVIDLGYAPGSWSQVAFERTKPRGLVIGIDLIPAQPPRGVTSIQGDFLSPQVQALVKEVLREQIRRKKREEKEQQELLRERKKREKDEAAAAAAAAAAADADADADADAEKEEHRESESGALAEERESGDQVEKERNAPVEEEFAEVNEDEEGTTITEDRPSYIDMEKMASQDIEEAEAEGKKGAMMVDIVLSDMSEPWPQTTGFMSNTLSNPYHRLMNTSGMAFRDHAGSMDLCHAALQFASDTLKHNGHFICKFYEGNESKQLETKLRRMFKHVHRVKPYSSRKESKEYFFVALSRKPGASLADAEADIARTRTLVGKAHTR